MYFWCASTGNLGPMEADGVHHRSGTTQKQPLKLPVILWVTESVALWPTMQNGVGHMSKKFGNCLSAPMNKGSSASNTGLSQLYLQMAGIKPEIFIYIMWTPSLSYSPMFFIDLEIPYLLTLLFCSCCTAYLPPTHFICPSTIHYFCVITFSDNLATLLAEHPVYYTVTAHFGCQFGIPIS